MADADLDAVRRAFAELTGLFEDAALLAAAGQGMRLTYLAPGVVKDLFEGRQPEALTAARLVSLCKDLPHDWQLQRAPSVKYPLSGDVMSIGSAICGSPAGIAAHYRAAVRPC